MRAPSVYRAVGLAIIVGAVLTTAARWNGTVRAECASTPTVASIEPGSGARNTTVAVKISGSGFVADKTSVQLRKEGSAAIIGAGVGVAPDGNSLTCGFDLTGAGVGSWNVVVTVNGCAPATLPGGFQVIGD